MEAFDPMDTQLDARTVIVTESRPGEILASLHESAEAEREYLFAARDADPSDLVLVAWQGDVAIGYIATTDQRQDGLLIWEHLVVPAHRSNGLGERLLFEAVRRTLPGAIVEVDPLGELDVERVADYYQRLGFFHESSDGRIWGTATEIMQAVDPGQVEAEDRSSIQLLLSRKAPGVVTIEPAATVKSAISVLNEQRIGAIIVSSNGSRVEGIFSERDVLLGLDEQGQGFLERPVGDVTTTDVLTCTTSDTIVSAMESMTRLRVRHLPVTKTGHLVGIISVGDLVRFRLDALETDLAPEAQQGN